VKEIKTEIELGELEGIFAKKGGFDAKEWEAFLQALEQGVLSSTIRTRLGIGRRFLGSRARYSPVSRPAEPLPGIGPGARWTGLPSLHGYSGWRME
jgi:hypothetical protein